MELEQHVFSVDKQIYTFGHLSSHKKSEQKKVQS
uniref:Uncharacterized protein n=1 Tax=viral metagenome TaxID=1070528 RepID=A0A6C0ARW8_9ZZZZ